MTDDELDARLRQAHDHLLAQIENDPTMQARQEEFLRKLTNGELSDNNGDSDEPRRLQWGMTLDRDATRIGAENTVPVFDGPAHVGDMELSDANAAALGVMLLEATDDQDDAADTNGIIDWINAHITGLTATQQHIISRAFRRRIAYLEDKHTEQKQAIGRVRAVHTRLVVHEAADRCLCPDRDDNTHPVEEVDGAYICERTPIGAVCAYCLMPDADTADSLDGEHVNWPCPTVAAIDNTAKARQ